VTLFLDDEPLASDAIRAALKGYEPSAEQWDAIRAGLEPVAIVAGAGSGKTAVMTARIVHLIESGRARAASVLGLTFTNKAAAELEDRLGAALAKIQPHGREHPTVLTYNAFAAQLVREHGPRIGIDSDSGLLTQAQKWQMLLRLVGGLPNMPSLELRHPLSFIPQTLSLTDQCANHLVSPEELEAECERILAESGLQDQRSITATEKRREFSKIIRAYIDAKRAARRIDFGDQIALAVRILRDFGDVVDELRGRYQVILLDEYQDTDPAQKLMLQYLCPPGSAVTAVGDARQAIYGWRGASMFNLLNFDREFPRADGKPCRMLSLRENFRSGRRIVELANRVIEQVPPERRRGEELAAVDANGEGWVGAGVFSDQQTEASWIADEINRLHEAGTAWREVAILVRTKRYMDRIVAALSERDIPFEIPDVGGLLKIPAVVDIVAWLRIISDRGPATNRWLARILTGPRFRVHYRDLAPIARWASSNNRELTKELQEMLGIAEPDPGDVGFSLLEGLEHAGEIDGVSDEARSRIAELLALVDQLRPLASRPLLDLVQSVASRTGLMDQLLASSSRVAASMIADMHRFLGVCAEFSPVEGEPTLGTFLDFLDAAEEAEDAISAGAVSNADSVKVMTVHAAKGLEFDVAFVPVIAASPEVSHWDGMRLWSVFPNTSTSDPMTSTMQLPYGVRRDREWLPKMTGTKASYIKELKSRAEEDERRLFYVAITRARQRLYCTAAHWYEPDERKGPSVFLDEVLAAGANLVDVVAFDEAPETSPLVEVMRQSLHWPPRPHRLDDGVLAWIDKVERLRSGSLEIAEVLAPSAVPLFEEHMRLIEALSSGSAPAPVAGLRSLAATNAARLVSGREVIESVLHPLPEPPTDARRTGVEVHAWIEEHARGLTGLAEEEALDFGSPPPDRELVERLRSNWIAMGYPSRTVARLDSGEPMAEIPFSLKLGGVVVRGRIDCVYEDGAGLEIVDFKTGSRPQEPDLGQLELYAEALRELGVVSGAVRLTYAWLADATTTSWTYEPRGLDEFESGLGAALGA
jgi:DNA helicase-2/ATP-dependent DNA helicase PcrA